MQKERQYPISIDGSTFSGFKQDFDQMLRQLISEMEKRESEEATITAKMTVRLKPDQARDFKANGDDAMRDIIKPMFEHKISSVMQVKAEKSGSLGGNYELVWDAEQHRYVMVEIDNGQQSLFDHKADDAEAVEGELVESAEEGVPALEPPRLAALPPVEGEFREVESADQSPYEFLKEYLGEEMKVLEQNGLYTVRVSSNNRIILSSAVPENHPFYCAAETLERHVGHEIRCVIHQQEFEHEWVNYVAIKCVDCDEFLFMLQEPTRYDYDPPEE